MDGRSSERAVVSEYALPELRSEDDCRGGECKECKPRHDEQHEEAPQEKKRRKEKGQAPKNNRDVWGSRRLLSPQTLLYGRWEVGELLSEGGFGQIYRAVDRRTGGREVAIKAEATNAHLSLLHIESLVLQLLNRRYRSSPHRHFPFWHSEGTIDDANFIVMDLCGPNLRELKKATANDRFSVTTSLWLTSQMIRALQVRGSCDLFD